VVGVIQALVALADVLFTRLAASVLALKFAVCVCGVQEMALPAVNGP
jgi:hypothetical protein